MNPLTRASAALGICVCCCLGASRATASPEHPLAPSIAMLDETRAPSTLGSPTVTRASAPAPPPAAAVEQAGVPAGDAPGHPSMLRVPQTVGGVAAGFLNRLDHQTFKPGTWDNSFFERAGRELGGPGTLLGGTALFAMQGWASGDQEQVETAGLMGLGYLGTSATVQGLKSLTGRTRPDGSDDYSFPSGHTANSFLAAAVLAKEYGGATAVVSYGAATLVGASRIAGGRHHFSDVLVGAVIGQLFGFLVTSLDND